MLPGLTSASGFFTLNIGNGSQCRYVGVMLSIVDAATVAASPAYAVVAIVEPCAVEAKRVDVPNAKTLQSLEIHVPAVHAPLVAIPVPAPTTGGIEPRPQSLAAPTDG